MTKKTCKDCPEGSRRPTPHPGPRCATHHRDRKKALREASWGRSLMERYGITPRQYWALYEAQGGLCYMCRRAKGGARRLAVDHDHASGYVRGLLCSPCNKLLGHARDEVDFFVRGQRYLTNPPAFDVIGRVKPDGA